MLKNLKRAAAIVLSFAMAIQFGLANSYYVNAEEEPVEPQQEQTTTVENNNELQEEETNEVAAPETKSVELSYVAEDGTILQAATYRDFDLNYSLNADSSVMLNFDGYTLKDVIVNNSHAASADQVSLNVTSELASVQFVYKKVITETDHQTAEQPKTEEKNDDDAEADPDSETEVKEELPEYPAFIQSETAGNVVVHATAAEGVLPRGSKLVVKRITRKSILNAVEETVSEKNKEVESAVALDITIQNKDGVEIQPNGLVNISFENVAVTGEEVNVYHVTNDANTVTEVATNTQSFDTNHFSIYVITGENQVPLTTFNFVVNDTTVSTQIVKSGDTLIAPTAPDAIGQAFVGWVDEAGNPFTGFGKQSEITETTTRTITARYEAALYVYFLNPDGSQIMRTEKVGDHEAHDFTTVSYDVDSTHKLVGWAAEASGTKNIANKITVPTNQTSVNVYAIIKEGYWVSFNSDGGSIVDSQFVLHGDNLDLDKIPDPTKPGYTFDGWYNGSAKVENVTTVTSSMTLTAHWKAAQVNYTINYWQQKVTDDKNAEDAQKTYEYVEAVTKKATTGTKISATNSKTYKGFKYNANNSSKDVKISGDGTTIINVYYDRVLCTVNFYAYESTGWFGGGSWNIIKTVTGLYGANLPEGAWDTSTYNWRSSTSSWDSSGCVLLTSFDFESAGYANNQGNKTTNGIVTTCNFYGNQQSESGKINYYNEQADGSYVLAQSIITSNRTLTVHEKFAGYELYKYSIGYVNGESAAYWNDLSSEYNVSDGDDISHEKNKPINIASKLKTYSLSYYNYNSVTKTEKNIKYTASLKSYANYTPARPSGLPEYYVFGGWYKDKACTTKFDFNAEKMPNANVQIYAKWAAKKINLTYNLNTPDGTSKKVNGDVDAGTIASDVLPSIPTVDEYSFAGWYVADGAGHMTTEVFNANDPILKDTNVIGKWLYNGKLTVKYVADGVEAPKDNNVYAGGAKATVANGVEKKGKKFLGWQLDDNVYQPGQNFEVNKDLADDKNVITLTAKFGDSETSAILNYHPGNGDGEDQSVAILNNVEVTLKSTSNLHYSAPGEDYYFAGWATSMEDARKGNAKYAVGDKVRVNADSSNDLYATWVEKTVINVTANSNTLPYNGEVQKVEGFQDVVGGYTVTVLTAVATGKDAGTYETKITGTAKVTKDGVDVTDKVIVNVTKGKLTISKREVTLTSETASKPYDGIPLTKPEVTIIGGFVKDEVTEVQATGSVKNVSEGEVTNTITYKTSDKFNANNYSIIKNEGKLSITPVTDEVTVRIKGNKDTVTYNGEEQSVSGYTVDSISNTLYSSTDFTLNGQATATGKDANTYPMNLDATQFVNNNTNFSNVKFEIAEDGQLVITPVTDKVTVTIKGNKDTATYDGNPHSVEGYVITDISNKLYKENDIGFTGEAKAEGIEAATYQMNLKKDQFSNTSQNFTDVEFVVEDGTLTISPKSITPDGPDTPEEKKTGITVTAPEGSKYDGEEHKNKPTVIDTKTDKVLVEGTDYELTYSEDVINAGTVTVTVTGKGNYEGSFEVTYEITKRDVTLTSGSASKVYDKTALTKNEVTVSGDGFVKNEGATYDVTGSRTKVGSSKNTFTYELKSNTKASNYNIEVKFGDLIVTAEDGEVVVTITGHSDTVEYDGNEKSVSGYDVSITEGSTYTTDDFTFNGTAEAKGIKAGTYPMNLAADQFTNTNDNYTQVTFIVTDGSLTITPKSIVPTDDNGITVEKPADTTYNGSEQRNKPVVKDSKTKATLVEGTDYTLAYTDATNAGTVTVTITGIGNYNGTVDTSYEIKPKEYTVTTNTASKVYDGTALTASGKVEGIVSGETYNFTITGTQTDVGSSDNTYTFEWNGTAKKSNYKLAKESIGKLTVNKQSIVPDPDHPETYKEVKIDRPKDVTYDGKKHKWAPTVTDKDGNSLVVDQDYKVTYSTTDFTNVTGEIKVTITGIGNYTGSLTRKYRILRREYKVVTDSKSKVYDGDALTAGGKVEGIVKGEIYSFTITGTQTEVGSSANTYDLKWTGSAKSSNYRHGKDSIGTLTVKAQSIVPDPEHPETYLGIEIDSPSDITYDGKEHKWSPVVSSKAKTALVAGKDYAVEYSTTDFTNVAGEITVTIRGINNYTGSLTRTYKILPREYTVTTESDSKVYDGTALTAGGKIEGIVKGETYSFTITGAQTDVGSSDNTYDLKWTGSAKESNYKHGKDSIGTLTVKAKSIVPDGPDTPEEKKTGITVSDPSDSKYDGKEHREVLTVKDTKTDKKLVADKDYSVTYSDDLVNAGTVTIKVAGLGNYTGSFEKTYKITKRSVTLTSANATKTYDGTALTNTSITVSGDGFVEGEGAEYKVTGTQTQVGNSANSFEYKLNENTLASNYDITKVVGTLTITAAPAPVIPAPTPRTPSVPQVITPVETVEKEETPKAEEPKTEKVEKEYTPKASPQYYWALINLICAIVTVLFGLLLLISKRHKDEDDKEDDETKQQTNNDDEEKEQEKKRGLFTRVLAVLIAIASVVFFLVTEDMSLDWTWTDQWTIWMVVLGIVQIVVFFIGRKWKNVDNDDEDEEAQQA